MAMRTLFFRFRFCHFLCGARYILWKPTYVRILFCWLSNLFLGFFWPTVHFVLGPLGCFLLGPRFMFWDPMLIFWDSVLFAWIFLDPISLYCGPLGAEVIFLSISVLFGPLDPAPLVSGPLGPPSLSVLFYFVLDRPLGHHFILFWALGTSFGCRFSFFVFFLGGGSWLTGNSKCKAQRRLSANGEESKGDRFLFDATA